MLSVFPLTQLRPLLALLSEPKIMRPSAAESFLRVLGENLDVLAGPVVALVYPMYASIRAIETRSGVDDQQWLTYWVLYAIITLFELTFAKLVQWLPFWSYAKLIFTCWLVMPFFSGASRVYKNIVRPYLITREKSVDIWYVPGMKDVFRKQDDIIIAAEKYMQENGPEAFQKIIHRSKRESSNNFTNDYTFYDDSYRYEDEHRY